MEAAEKWPAIKQLFGWGHWSDAALGSFEEHRKDLERALSDAAERIVQNFCKRLQA